MVVKRMQEFGETIFATMTQLALDNHAVNLGQGFPDSDGPKRMLEIAQEQIATGRNQYAPGMGVMALREAISADNNVPVDNVLVTVGASEAIAASVLGLVEPGQEVIVIEPYYDSYAAAIALAGAQRVAVPLKAVGNTWDIDVPAIRAAVTDRTAMIIINSPHNPTGAIFSEQGMRDLASLCVERDLLVLSDEVYEHLTFGDAQHREIRLLPGLAERTIKVSSAAKTFNVTGWKTGWAIATPALLDGVVKAKQFITFVGATPFQAAVAYALREEGAWVESMVAELSECRSILVAGLESAGYRVHDTKGTYYVVADVGEDAGEFCKRLPAEKGVAAIPLTAFTDHPDPWKHKVRFAFSKRPEIIREAVRRLNS
ncbi:aminotransferase class I/II-fold pyridoxal phosphate-dependent enzyme [Corynebacterium flavescens]|uniref:aminotransferase class I/II-fold pyridoxal phosphate-dependent enzyme n=1 Tax=Corynebacterium flavescens TaxID=28028 RepID=UPI00264849F1|nr:aminotransferase class I/II-fold pyridoxal phosphate-dependent enzyme [Corynebacterium flavescens]MDN6098889.1 aminotransferase class I/II-fold pyridoxal phosphate-dependent enzyme [Corynebacterium flavescens]MDN6199895.1 aminotransferase class I/II-fold pyridoxal phosphate-dependent enzyme [Corynebacterium flavescens]MDN6227482.1 aminotransferase class I/II-fold pyridoxal phosphate-dependent enzyme [Corynebacterium flavescens]MDN6236608.1 aminotransferase class I/II-fold pyridoxal phosphate